MAVVSPALQELDCCLSEPLTIANMRAIFLLLVKAHYSDAKNFGLFEEELGCLAIDIDSEDNDLTIGLDFTPDDKNPSPRPAIWVNFQGNKLSKVSFDNFSGVSEDNATSTFIKLQLSTFNFTHIHDSVDVAYMMAESTADFFAGIAPHLRSKLGISMMDVQGITKARLIEKSPEKYYGVDVTLSMHMNHVVSANIESHRLKKFALELTPE